MKLLQTSRRLATSSTSEQLAVISTSVNKFTVAVTQPLNLRNPKEGDSSVHRSSEKPVDLSCVCTQGLCVAVPLPRSLQQSQFTQTLYHTFRSILWLSTEAEDLCLFYIKAIQIHCPGFLLLLQRETTLSEMHLKHKAHAALKTAAGRACT